RQDAEIGRQPNPARRADQRSRRGDTVVARGSARGFPRLRGHHQPRPLLLGSHRDAHPVLRGRQPCRMVRGQFRRLRGGQEAPARRGRRAAQAHQIQKIRAGLTERALPRALNSSARRYKHIFMSDGQDARLASPGLSRAQSLGVLRAAGEATRLRILALLAGGELNVKDLTQILGQSQPRISRHLKLMAEVGLIRRFREGSWVFFRLADSGAEAALATAIVASLDQSDLTLARDRARAAAVQKARAETAQAYFKAHASEWDNIRALHVAESQVEAAMDAALGHGPFGLLV